MTSAPAGIELRLNWSAGRQISVALVPMRTRSSTVGRHVEQLKLKLPYCDVLWIVIVGSSATGNRRARDFSQPSRSARSMVKRSPVRRTSSERSRGVAATPAASTATGAAIVNAGYGCAAV